MKKLYSIAFLLFTVASFAQGGYSPFAKLRLTTTPVENNIAKQVLVRDETTGNVNYVSKDSLGDTPTLDQVAIVSSNLMTEKIKQELPGFPMASSVYGFETSGQIRAQNNIRSLNYVIANLGVDTDRISFSFNSPNLSNGVPLGASIGTTQANKLLYYSNSEGVNVPTTFTGRQIPDVDFVQSLISDIESPTLDQVTQEGAITSVPIQGTEVFVKNNTVDYAQMADLQNALNNYASLWNRETFNYSGSQDFELAFTPLSLYSYTLNINGKTANVTNTSLSGKTITVLFPLQSGDIIDVSYQYSASLVGTVDKNLDLQNRGLLPPKDYTQSKYIDSINGFVEKYRKRESDVTLVEIGDSISTDLGYTTPNPNASTSPPFMTEMNINTAIESKLRWKEQKYKRYDVSGTFTEILGGGTSTVINTDDAWSLVGSSHRFPLTKVITGGTNAGVSFVYPSGIKRLGFIHHTDFKFATQTQVTIAEGNGLVEVFDETDETWKEANGFIFTAKESSSLLPSGIYKDQDQKRLELRSLSNITAKNVSIKNIGTGRFGYWGIEYSPKEFMFKYIASSIGGTNIFQFRKFEEWRVDSFKPDLILQQCNIINEAAQAGGDTAYPPERTPQNFRNVYETYYDALIAKDYLVFPYILFVGLQGGIVNPSTGEWGVGTFAGKEVTIDDYIGQLSDLYQSKNAPYMNCFYQYLDIAYNLARQQGTNNIFASAIYGTGINGTSFTIDSVHLNNYGQEIAKRLLLPIFNF